MDDIAKILEQQEEILRSIHRLEEEVSLIKFLHHSQYDETNARLEMFERSLRQIDEQLALSNMSQESRDDKIKKLLSEFQRANQSRRLNMIEELLRLIAANQIMDSLEPPKKPRGNKSQKK